jgi:transcription initiation factor TFIID subunit 12
MSNPQQPQVPQGQQQPQLLKPDDLAKLQCLSDDQKQKYRPVLQNFWSMMQTKPAGTPEHNQASSKLREWSSKLIAQERSHRARIKSQSQASQPNPAMQQPGQGQPGQQVQQAAQPGSEQQQPAPAKPQAPTQSAAGSQQQPNQAQGGQPNPQQQPPQVNPEIMKHVEQFPYALQPPPQGGPVPGTPEAAAKLKEARNTYLMVLVKQEKSTNKVKALQNLIQQREKTGQPIPPELINEKQKSEAEYFNAKKYIEEFRRKQKEWKEWSIAAQGGQRPAGQQQAQPAAQPLQPQSQPAVKPEPQIKVEGGQQPQPAGQFGNMQSGGTPQNNGSAQNAQAPRPPPQAHAQQSGQFTPGQQGPPRPQINPQQANASMQQQNNSPHPHSASSNPAGPPVPLSHQAAVSAAQRSYSQSDQRTNTPLQTGQGSFHAPGSREREQLNNPKMPIPRTLPVTQPVPVSMGGGGRPTLAGPTNGAPGPMGQPVIQKFPPFQLEGEGDRVLSKRKLDELVRQVTGGTEDALTPEVEEVSLVISV